MMTKSEYLRSLAKQMELIPDEAESYEANKRLIKSAAMLVGWRLSEPLPHKWDYWHCITNKGGVIPFCLEFLIERLNEQAIAEER